MKNFWSRCWSVRAGRSGLKGEGMGTLVWCNDYSVHISSIDNEHKLLIELIKELENALETQEMVRFQLVSSALERLTRHIRAHFESEERFLLFNNYPDYGSHQMEHQDLLLKLNQFVRLVHSGNFVFTEQELLFLKDWLARHIILHDCKYGNYFRGMDLAT